MYPVKHWVDRFREFSRRTPTEIVLPALGKQGPTYDSSVHPFPNHFLTATSLLPSWIRDAREIVGEKGSVWVLVDPALEFMKNGSLWLRNQYFDELPQACINNSVVQSVLHDFILELSSIGGIDGIALDLTDAYPNAGTSGYEGIMVHCFCDHCSRDLREMGSIYQPVFLPAMTAFIASY
jgi:hypothetical protein